MSTTALPAPQRLAWLNLVVDALPTTRNAIYEAARRGTAPFLHRIDIYTGQPSKFWAIDPDGLALHYRRKGKRLNEKFRAAVEAAAVAVNPAWFADVDMEAAQKN